MLAAERVAQAMAAELAARLGRRGPVRPIPGVAETAQRIGPPAAGAEGLKTLDELAHQTVKALLALSGKEFSPGAAAAAVERAARKWLLAEGAANGGNAAHLARLAGEVPRLLNLPRLVELANRGLRLPAAAAAGSEPQPVGGASPAFARVLEELSLVAATDFPVLLVGETGTGKEILARRLHRLSPRREGPFVAINCAGMAAGVLESELFGHGKGAFTGADTAQPGQIRRAQGGTLFLDEIGESARPFQLRLLRVLEDRAVTPVGGGEPVPVDFRLVCASHRDLTAAAGAGEFLPALLYRIQVVPLELPPLRERPEDLPELIQHFLDLACLKAKKSRALAPETARILAAHAWPGNVRELKHLIERLVVLSPAYEIGPDLLPPSLTAGRGDLRERLAGLEGVPAARVTPLAAFLAASQGRELANQDLRRALGCSDTTAKKLLGALARGGLLEQVGARGGRRYLVRLPG